MDKNKIIVVGLLIILIAFVLFSLMRIKQREEFRQKTVLAQEIRKVLDHMMFDLLYARESTIQDAPADGAWHNRIAFVNIQKGPLEYLIKEGHLVCMSKGKIMMIADNIDLMRIRRQQGTPNILEVQIEARKSVSLMSNLKIRISH